ncbi:nucleotide exchange factor GrpE [Ectothiorhodospiraceae bacterium BW-2]|nr:nucleotide exchange factor GrpE [Ectothiorhodospiraceae bacterium BW-2]
MQKEELLSAFSLYLDRVEPEEGLKEQPIDLHTLLTEMAALRTEVKTESRQFKGVLEEFHKLYEITEQSQQQLNQSRDHQRQLQQQFQESRLRDMLLDTLELYDRMHHALEQLNNYQPGLFSRHRDQQFIEAVRQGQQMTLNRIEQLLERYQVEPLQAIGRLLDPHTMRAVETVKNPKLADGTVCSEQRRGFLWNGTLLRTAEVSVNKLTPTSQENN